MTSNLPVSYLSENLVQKTNFRTLGQPLPHRPVEKVFRRERRVSEVMITVANSSTQTANLQILLT